MKIASVTGGSGFLGSYIVDLLINDGWKVKILTRKSLSRNSKNIEYINGDLNNFSSIKQLLHNSIILIHAASEIKETSKMYETNVQGTKNLMKIAKTQNLKYFCYISSAGAYGYIQEKVIKEDDKCNPVNVYQKSKLMAEKIIINANMASNCIILRPTNVVGDEKYGILSFLINFNFRSRLYNFIRGNEFSHIVHVSDVARACIFCSHLNPNGIQIYNISIDHDKDNLITDLFSLFLTKENSKRKKYYLLPHIFPHIIRILLRGRSIQGNIRYSSEKIINEGFRYNLSIQDIIKKIKFEKNKQKHF